MPDLDTLDLTNALPCAADAAGGEDPSAKPGGAPMLLSETPFRYDGRGLTGPEFKAYVASYDFGMVPPDQLVFHNTYLPDASWAPVSANQPTWWDRAEAGLSLAQIYAKRKAQLDAIMRYYRDTYGWDRGPHLFVDDLWIWLFTPMYDIGIHAAEGNSYRDSRGKLHYSLGIETVGYFASHGWPAPMQALLRTAVGALAKRLKIALVYKQAPLHRPELHQGSIAFHRDYNKAACPGSVITPAYAIDALTNPHGVYLIKGLPIYNDSRLTQPSGRFLMLGSKVTIDRVAAEQPADYAPSAAHIADAEGGGFIDLNGAVKP
jgi:hypothetical protein